MLSENVYVNEEVDNYDQWKTYEIKWVCDDCGEETVITPKNIGDLIGADPHDPLEDYLFCPCCDNAYGLFRGVFVTVDDEKALLHGDGTYIYVKDKEGEHRIV